MPRCQLRQRPFRLDRNVSDWIATNVAMHAISALVFGKMELFRCQHVNLVPQHRKVDVMDKDRIKGSAQQSKGTFKEVAGKVLGDAKLEAEGKSDKAAGKVQNALGGLKDTLRGK